MTDFCKVAWEIVESPIGIGIILTIILYLWKRWGLINREELERWDGLIKMCFDTVEKSKVSGPEKLIAAIKIFTNLFPEIYGSKPSEQDIADAKMDLSREAAARKTVEARLKYQRMMDGYMP